VVGAENIAGTVDQKDVVAFGEGFDGNGFRSGGLGGFGHGRNLRIFAANDSLWRRNGMSNFVMAGLDPAIHVFLR
jgi:hypothetical protein